MLLFLSNHLKLAGLIQSGKWIFQRERSFYPSFAIFLEYLSFLFKSNQNLFTISVQFVVLSSFKQSLEGTAKMKNKSKPESKSDIKKDKKEDVKKDKKNMKTFKKEEKSAKKKLKNKSMKDL